MSTEQIIALVAAIATGISALATLLTVWQMSRQRKASYMPELVLLRTLFQGTANPITEGPIPSHWVSKSDVESTSDLNTFFSMPLTNIGLGAAKDISVSWSFSIEDVIRGVNDLAQKTLTPLYLSIEGGAVSIKSDSLGSGASIWKNQQRETLDYVLPAAVQKEPVQLKVPHAFVVLCSALLYVSSKDENKTTTLSFPPLIASLKYRDIGNKVHTSTFEISLQIVAFGGNGDFLSGYLEPKKYG